MEKSSPGPAAKNSKFADDKRSKGFNQGGIPSKDPEQALVGEATDTAAEKATNELKEDIGK